MEAMSLENLITNYLQETRRPNMMALEQAASLRSPEMLKSIEKFSRAVNAATKKTGRKAAASLELAGTERQVTDNLSSLVKTVADFVTPGDLFKCIDLFSVGQMSPEN